MRPNSTFNAIDVVQSTGEGTYNALTVTMNKRMRNGWQMQANYTSRRARTTVPSPRYVLATGDDRVSDPSNLDRDKGVAPFNQTHTFALSTLLQPKVSGDGFGAALVNNNQLGLIVQANSGLPFNIRTNRDLNNDGNAANDRPLGIDRNTGKLGSVVNVDAPLRPLHSTSGSAASRSSARPRTCFNTLERLRRSTAWWRPTPRGIRPPPIPSTHHPVRQPGRHALRHRGLRRAQPADRRQDHVLRPATSNRPAPFPGAGFSFLGLLDDEVVAKEAWWCASRRHRPRPCGSPSTGCSGLANAWGAPA